MSKVKTLKELLEQSPEQITKILRSLKGETDDAVTKLGSGKNLEALKRASEDIADQSRKPFPPAYPKTITPDDLAQKPGFKLEGQPFTTEAVMVPEGTGVPALRRQTLPQVIETTATKVDDVTPLMSKQQPKSLGETADALKGALDDALNPGMSLKKKLGIGAGGLAAGAGVLSMGDDEEPQKTTPVAQPREREEKQDDEVKVESKSKPILAEGDQEKIIEIGRKASESPGSVTDEETDYLKMLMSAQQSDNQLRFVNNLLRAGTTIGAAIAGVKPDYSGVDALEKQISGTSQVKDLMKTEAAQRQLDDEKALRDPNSSVSKNLRDLLVKAGYPTDKNISAKNLKDMGVNIYNLLGQRQAAEIAANARTEARGLNEDDRQKRFVQSLRKELVTGAIGKQYSNYLQSERIGSALVKFRENPSGYKDYATLMGGLKALQGDESVVREAEVRMGRQAASLIDTAINSVEKLRTGKMLTDRQRGQMIETIQILSDIGRESFLNSAAPILEQADREGIDKGLILPTSLMSEKKTDIPEKSKMVRVQRLSDGLIKVVPKTATGNLDSKKYKILD